MIKKVVIAAGGTGGHIYPGVALAQCLLERSVDVCWIGSGSALEKRILKPYAWTYRHVQAKPLRGARWRQKMILPWFLGCGIARSMWYLWVEKPQYVLTTGGYVSVTCALAAWLMRIPVFMCEQNARPGMANRLISRFSRGIFTAYPDVFPVSLGKNVLQTGNPLRKSLLQASVDAGQCAGRSVKRLMVLGGSQGASILNDKVPGLFSGLQDKSGVEVLHVAGKWGRIDWIEEAYQDAGVKAEVVTYLDDIAQHYKQADLVIARAGALTLSELVQFALPAILVPLPGSADNHQFYNAWWHKHLGVCELIEQSVLDQPDVLLNTLQSMLRHDRGLARMRQAAMRLRTPHAATAILDSCQRLVQKGKSVASSRQEAL